MSAGLFADAARAGLYHLPSRHRHDLAAQAASAGQKLLSTDVGDCDNMQQALQLFGRAFGFPAWYGANFDALHDCLGDPDWHPGQGIVLEIRGLDRLRRHDPMALSTLVDVLRSAAAERSATHAALWILLGSPARGVPDLPAA